MQREIKFRAWTGKEIIGPLGDLSFFTNNTYLANEEIPLLPKHLMQFTGLKDKNGVEIYEGDVVHLPNRFDGDYTLKPRNSVVEWDEVGWYVSGQCESHWSTWEVIGNIYENPELLN